MLVEKAVDEPSLYGGNVELNFKHRFSRYRYSVSWMHVQKLGDMWTSQYGEVQFSSMKNN